MNDFSLAPQTGKIIEAISKLDCIKPFVLVGGTALSLQLHARQSEDLDFMRWKDRPNDTLDIEWPKIKKQLETVGSVTNTDILGFDQALFVVEGVKVSFYAAPRYRIPTMQEISLFNNLRIADVESIGVMKLEAMSRRSNFRDYYDIYCIMKQGCDINKIIPLALAHSEHRLKTKGLISILTNGGLFRKDEKFARLNPVYDVNSNDIENYIKSMLRKEPLNESFKEIDNNSTNKELETNAIAAIVQRTKDPSARSFTKEQSTIIEAFLSLVPIEEKNNAIKDVWQKAETILNTDGVNKRWQEDAHEELIDLGNGKKRGESNGYHK